VPNRRLRSYCLHVWTLPVVAKGSRFWRSNSQPCRMMRTQGTLFSEKLCEDQTQRQEGNESTEGTTQSSLRASRLAINLPIPRHAQFHRSPLGEGRNASSSRGPERGCEPEELNQWLRRTSGEAIGVHVVTPGSDLLKDLRASLAVQKSSKNSPPQPKNESRSSRGTTVPKTKVRQGAKGTYRDD
jgi:hypothetical protein